MRSAEHANVFVLTAGVLGVVTNAIAAGNRPATARLAAREPGERSEKRV